MTIHNDVPRWINLKDAMSMAERKLGDRAAELLSDFAEFGFIKLRAWPTEERKKGTQKYLRTGSAFRAKPEAIKRSTSLLASPTSPLSEEELAPVEPINYIEVLCDDNFLRLVKTHGREKRNRIGRPPIYDWDFVWAEIIKSILARSVPDSQAKFADYLQQRYSAHHSDQPGDTEMKKHLKKVWPLIEAHFKRAKAR